MRKIALVMALSVVAGTLPAMAQEPPQQSPQQQPAQQMPGPTPEQGITAINIIRFEDLPPQVKTVVETKLNDASADDLRDLHASIQASPSAMTMLAQNGLNVTQVVAAAVDPTGTLTLVIQDTA